MKQGLPVACTVGFAEPEVVLAENGAFECLLSQPVRQSDLSLVIDLYDMDNPVHPEGHLGWWQFSVNQLPPRVKGSIRSNGAAISCELDGVAAAQSWVNERAVEFKRLVVNAVLRAGITNAIVYLDRVPAFRTRAELSGFRATLDRNWNQPRFASPGYLLPRGGTVRILSRNIFTRDAVGNLCLDLYRMLRQNRIPVEIYSHTSDLALNDLVRRVEQLVEETNPDDQLLYFHSTYEPELDRLLELGFKQRIAYFHGVTRPELLQVFDPELAATCRKGIEQISRLEAFDQLAANSRTSATRLIEQLGEGASFSVEDVSVIPPRLLGSNRAGLQGAGSAEGERTKLLYVGRIKSSKRIEHLLEFYAEYRRLEPEAELWIVGGGADKAYWDYLKWTELNQLQLPKGGVHWAGSVSDSELAAHYASATAYLSMSEDEGFCLPVFEAMLAGVPVFAFGLPAVQEVMQNSGVYFLEKDFVHLAAALHALLSEPERVGELISRQRERAELLAREMDGRGFFKLLEPRVPRPVTHPGDAGS